MNELRKRIEKELKEHELSAKELTEHFDEYTANRIENELKVLMSEGVVKKNEDKNIVNYYI